VENMWQTLLADAAVVLLLIGAWTAQGPYLERAGRRWQAMACGLLFSAGVVVVMAMPFRLAEGFYFDLRTSVIVLSGLAGGPIACAMTVFSAVAYRISTGGGGVPAAMVGLANVGLVGLAASRMTYRGRAGWVEAVYLGLWAATGSILAFLVLPSEIIAMAFDQVAFPVGILIFASTFAAAGALIQERRRREAVEANQIYKAVIEALPDCLNAKDLQGRFLAANPATAALMRASSAADLIGRTDFDFYPEEVAASFRADEETAMAAARPVLFEQYVTHVDGSAGWLSTVKTPLRNISGEIIGLITHNRDISDRKRLEDDLRRHQGILTTAMANMADGVAMFDIDGCLVFCNEQYRRFFPLTADLRHPGTMLKTILLTSIERGEEVLPSGASPGGWLDGIVASLAVQSDRVFQLADGRWIDARTRPIEGGCLIVYSDVTEHKLAEQTLRMLNENLKLLAHTDGLTGLINRRGFDLSLEREFHLTARGGSELSLLLIDLDRFKAYNDVYGHQGGDECLIAVAGALRGTLRRPGDVAARYGGEELAAILPTTPVEGALKAAEAFKSQVNAMRMPHIGSERSIVTVSIGVASTLGASSIRELVRHADEALYSAKAAGRDQIRTWRPAPKERTLRA